MRMRSVKNLDWQRGVPYQPEGLDHARGGISAGVLARVKDGCVSVADRLQFGPKPAAIGPKLFAIPADEKDCAIICQMDVERPILAIEQRVCRVRAHATDRTRIARRRLDLEVEHLAERRSIPALPLAGLGPLP